MPGIGGGDFHAGDEKKAVSCGCFGRPVQESVASWSVTAIPVRPLATAAATNSSGSWYRPKLVYEGEGRVPTGYTSLSGVGAWYAMLATFPCFSFRNIPSSRRPGACPAHGLFSILYSALFFLSRRNGCPRLS